jgi:hypothetical protein
MIRRRRSRDADEQAVLFGRRTATGSGGYKPASARKIAANLVACLTLD